MKSKNRKRRMTKFKKILLIYSGVLAIPMIIFLIYVTNSLISYENNQLEKYIDMEIGELKKAAEKGKLTDIIGSLPNIEKSKYESDNVDAEEGLKELLKSDKISYKLSEKSTSDDAPIYDIYIDNNPIFELSLDGSQKEQRLGLLTYSIWKTNKITNKMEKGIFSYVIEIPSTYKVSVNKIELSKEDIKKSDLNESIEQVSLYQEIPYMVTYEITNLIKKPTITITDENNNEVDYEEKASTIKIALDIKKAETKEDALKMIDNAPDIMKIAEDWSLFLSRDLKGTLHGYNDIKKYFIDKSYMADYAYKWATNIDIMFISAHDLDDPTFTNEELKNFEIYSDKAFSCEVYLEKNLTLKKTNEHMQDIMHERMYFVKMDNEWKLVSMQTLKGDLANNE